MEGWLLASRKGEGRLCGAGGGLAVGGKEGVGKTVRSRWRAGCWRQGKGGEAVRSRGGEPVRSRWRAGCWRQGRGRGGCEE